jgi:hypothetical protein
LRQVGPLHTRAVSVAAPAAGEAARAPSQAVEHHPARRV